MCAKGAWVYAVRLLENNNILSKYIVFISYIKQLPRTYGHPQNEQHLVHETGLHRFLPHTWSQI